MPDVTVLGAGGATVTIALTSAQNAAAAQLAANGVTKLVQGGILEQQVFSGSGTLPAPSNLLGGALITDKAGNAGALTSQYVFAGVNAQGDSTIVGPQNAQSTVIAGNGSNLTYGNQSNNGQIWFGKATDTLVNFQGTANVHTDDGTYIVVTKAGATTNVNLGSGATALTSDLNGGSGANTINTGNGNVTVAAAGDSTVPVTVNATGGNLFLANLKSGSAVVNPGAANVTVVGNVGGATGATTLFGGAGSATVSNGIGSFTGGTAGKNIMFSSTIAGSATLIGGGTSNNAGSGDILVAQGKNQLLIAGVGNATLTARGPTADGGSTFIAGSGFSTVFGFGQGGNTYLFAGFGSALVDGRDEKAAGAASTNIYQDFTSPGGTHVIGDFLTGTDKFLLTSDYTLTFFNGTEGTSPFSPGVVGTELKLANGTTYLFFDTGDDGQQDIFDSDITKIG